MNELWVGRWAHGRIKNTQRGPRYVLEAKRDGRRYAIPLEARNEGQALLEWKAFEENPEEFRKHRGGLLEAGAPGWRGCRATSDAKAAIGHPVPEASRCSGLR